MPQLFRWLLPLVCLACVTVSPRSNAQKQAAPAPEAAQAYEPTKTRVAIVQVINKADDLVKDFPAKIQPAVYKLLVQRFTARGFVVADSVGVEHTLAEMKLDMTDRENWQAKTLAQIGKKLDCRLTLLCVVTDAHSKINDTGGNPFGGSREGIVGVRAYLVDTETETNLIRNKPVEGKSAGGIYAAYDKGLTREGRAVSLGLDKALKGFLSAYAEAPKTK